MIAKGYNYAVALSYGGKIYLPAKCVRAMRNYKKVFTPGRNDAAIRDCLSINLSPIGFAGDED